jgi:hypothetical protein
MNLGPIVDVAIGIIFVWIVLSLSTIQIQEWITTILDKRARDMEAAIHEMLANPNLKAQFYDHPVIRGLTAKKRKWPSTVPPWFYKYPIVRGFTREIRKFPSYIPSQQFSLALFDIVVTAGTESSLVQQGILKIRDDLRENLKGPKDQAILTELNILAEVARSAAATEAGTAITNRSLAYLKAEIANFSKKHPEYEGLMDEALNEADRLKGLVDEVIKKQPKAKTSPLVNLRRGVAAMSVISPEFNQSLNALLLNVEEYVSQGETDLAKARKNVENWFDDSMDRVSGVFKRYSQAMALTVGFVLALLLNVDSINLTTYLWREPAVRQALAESAANFELTPEHMQANPIETIQNFRNQFNVLSLPVGWVINDSAGLAVSDANCRLFPGNQEGFGIPILGTNRCIAPPASNNQSNLLVKLAGIIITALAARQGAPFWFDILKRAVNLRGTGANPAEKEGK